MSDAAERIEAARLVFVASRGTSREGAARANLQAAIRESIVAAEARGAVIGSATAAPDDSDDDEPQRLFDVVHVATFTREISESNRRTLEAALDFRGILGAFRALSPNPRMLEEIANELARNSAGIVLAMEIKKEIKK